ncbi:MAG: hypothetical protein LBV09_06250 [Deferribacteraceae bacterium]|jgi:hypothetical protein|nr:hypothetical protein [Deferribacteraceae bacterium]
MDIQVIGSSELVINGSIKSVTDYQEVKRIMTDMLRDSGKEITIRMPDSISITSSVIGYFLKLVYQDNVKITLIVSDPRLLSLLDDLRLTEAFNAVKE